ncbi:MAG: hypothetical protein K2Y37_20900 [Pirellulales bacterium]|nr:hypothetical protein [Pirellulales bacterium]
MSQQPNELRALACEALSAFWNVITQAYPGTATGDLSIDRTLALGTASEAAISEWIANNVPLGTERIATQEAIADIHALLEERRQIAVIWSVEDVQAVREDLTDDQAWDVLKRCDRKHDCNLGITWDTIEIVADDLFPVQDKGDGQ